MKKEQWKEAARGQSSPFPALEAGLRPLHELASSHPLPREAYYSRLTLELLSALMQKTLRLSRESGAFIPPEGTRTLALIRRVQTEQLSSIHAWLPSAADDRERALLLAALTLETGAALAQRMEETPLRQAIQFLLPEFLDALYRLANLVRCQGGPSASALLGHHLEIMPGRPLTLCQRHPADDAALPWEGMGPQDRLSLLLLRSAVDALGDVCCQAASRAAEELDRGLFWELALLEEQHATLLASLARGLPPLVDLSLHHTAVCWLYHSLACIQAGNAALCRLATDEGRHANAQWDAVEALARSLNPDAPPRPALPPPFLLGPCKGCVRDALQEIGHTLLLGRPAPAAAAPRDGASARYRLALCPDAAQAPSHLAAQKRISQAGQDERFEIAQHPIPPLRDRTRDALSLDPIDEPADL